MCALLLLITVYASVPSLTPYTVTISVAITLPSVAPSLNRTLIITRSPLAGSSVSASVNVPVVEFCLGVKVPLLLVSTSKSKNAVPLNSVTFWTSVLSVIVVDSVPACV